MEPEATKVLHSEVNMKFNKVQAIIVIQTSPLPLEKVHWSVKTVEVNI